MRFPLWLKYFVFSPESGHIACWLAFSSTSLRIRLAYEAGRPEADAPAGTAQANVIDFDHPLVQQYGKSSPKFRQLHGLLGAAYKSVRKAGECLEFVHEPCPAASKFQDSKFQKTTFAPMCSRQVDNSFRTFGHDCAFSAVWLASIDAVTAFQIKRLGLRAAPVTTRRTR